MSIKISAYPYIQAFAHGRINIGSSSFFEWVNLQGGTRYEDLDDACWINFANDHDATMFVLKWG